MSDPRAADEASNAPEPNAAPPSTDQHERLGAHLAAILGSLARLVDLQVDIWLTRTRMAAVRLAFCAMLGLFALLLAIIALLFLYAGLYHVLTDLLLIPTAWALLIFAGAHLVLAGILAVVAIGLLGRRSPQKPHGGGTP